MIASADGERQKLNGLILSLFTYRCSIFEQFQDMSLAITDLSNLSKPKQTRPSVDLFHFPGFVRNEYRRVDRKKHQVLFNKAPALLFCKKTFSLYKSPAYMV